MAKRKKAKRSKVQFTAKGADRHRLYQYSVQNTEQEVEIVGEAFRTRRGRQALTVKEDFCGTALFCAEWVQSDPRRSAVGVDLCPEVLDYGRKNNIEPLGDDALRIAVHERDVLSPLAKQKFDVVVAMNFSYFLFTTRQRMIAYFKAVREQLDAKGIFFLDCYGGWESQETMEEERAIEVGDDEDAFTYVWDQAYYNPINSACVNHIHFRFNDGTKFEKAFTYEWRLWQLAEIVEMLNEAGFSNVDTLWEDEDEDGEDLGTHSVLNEIENQPGWLCYIVAER